MAEYQRGTSISFSANYVDGNSTPILAGISGVTLDVYRYGASGTRIYSISATGMSQDPLALNRFYYTYLIPTTAIVTNYIAEYNAMFSGIAVQQTDEFGITQPVSATGIIIGNVMVSGAIVNISGSGILDASVNISALTGGPILTSTVTDASGNYVVMLDSGDYLLQAAATGYIPNNVPKSVPPLVNNFLFGNTTLLDTSCATANVAISDTYLTTNQNTNDEVPMSGMKVGLYQNAATAQSVGPISVAWTDASGTFLIMAAPGDYILRVQGNGPNNTVYDTSYDISVDPVYAPSNIRYKATSQYSFLI